MSTACKWALVTIAAVLTLGRPTAAQAGGEFPVNTYTTGSQSTPQVAMDSAGNFVVVWAGYNGGDYDIFGQIFDASGSRVGGEFQVNTYTTAPQREPVITTLGTGGFVVVWQSQGRDGDDYGLFGQRFDATGARVGADFQVNTYTTGRQSQASISADGSGNFVVVWQSRDQFGAGSYGIFGQRFDATGARLGTEFHVNASTASFEETPSVAVDHSGSFVVVWTDYDGSFYGISGQRFGANGAAAGTEFQVNTTTTDYQYFPAVAAQPNGGFVVVWTSYGQDGSGTGLVGQRFDGTGAHLGTEFQVNTYTPSYQFGGSVVSDAAGNFVVAWNSYGQDGDGYGVFGQQFAANGTKSGSEFQINTYVTGYQERPAIALNDAGRFVVAWQSYGQDGDGYGVFAQRYGAIALDRSRLRFGVVRNGAALGPVTPAQTVALTFQGAWTAASDQPFVSVTPSGNGTGLLTIQITGLTGLPSSGAAPTATITVSSPTATSSRTITVDVQVYSGATAPPGGFFDTPIDNSTGLTGAIGLTGWAIDDIGINRVELWRDRVNGDPAPAPNGKIFIGNATFASGARPDIEAAFPNNPLNYRAAWGYMLLTNLLPTVATGAPAGGVGTFTLYAYVYDIEGNVQVLPTRTFTCDNTVATKPFGTIDTPAQGALVSGTINNFGWVLTPQPGTMPVDGHTIVLYIDNLPRGTAIYNAPRSDIATLFPGYNNTSGPVGLFTIDTTTLTNGVHTIAWSATDSLGRADGIGSRYFTVLN